MPINYAVPGVFDIVAQPSRMSCWAAVGTMMMNWRDQKCRTINIVMESVGQQWLELFNRDTGLTSSQHGPFARSCSMSYEQLMCYPPAGWEAMLKKHGPLAVVTANPFHARIMTGIRMNSEHTGTVNLIDPDGGRRYDVDYSRFTSDFEGVARSPRFQVWHF